MALLELIENINLQSIYLSLNSTTILDSINLELKNDGIHCILGPNGSGKTMTNKIIALLIEPTNGKILWNHEDVTKISEKIKINLRRKIGFMNQKPIFLNRTVKSNLEIPLVIRNQIKSQRNEIVKEKLKEFELYHLRDKYPHRLSFGQQQKISLVRTLICDPHILILDEPTASLDLINTKWFENYMLEFVNDHGKIVLWTSHDQFQVKRIAHTISVIINGKLLETGTQAIFISSNNHSVKSFLEGKLVVE